MNMAYSTTIVTRSGTGRTSGQIYSTLRSQVLNGSVPTGTYLPTERQLSETYQVAHTTVRRAMARLQNDGLICAEPRKGYRVLGMANDPLRGCPVAFIRSERGTPASWDEYHARLMNELQNAADRRGWPLVAMGEGSTMAAKARARLSATRAWAAILDSNDPAILSSVRDVGIPVVIVDSWFEGTGIDSVLQDGHQGGLLACRCLAEAGCRRIAWFGPDARNVHVLERFGGYCAGLLNHGVPLSSDRIVSASLEHALDAARKMLAGAKRPDGVVVFWTEHARALMQAAMELGLHLGKDLRLVWWTPREMYESRSASLFPGKVPQPAITWNLKDMADAATAVLLERRAHPSMPELRMRVPVQLLVGS